jgi:hypothetical protein
VLSFPGFDLRRWSAVLAGRISTDKQSEDSARQAADALAEVLEPDDLQRLTQRLIEIQKNANKKEKKNG